MFEGETARSRLYEIETCFGYFNKILLFYVAITYSLRCKILMLLYRTYCMNMNGVFTVCRFLSLSRFLIMVLEELFEKRRISVVSGLFLDKVCVHMSSDVLSCVLVFSKVWRGGR